MDICGSIVLDFNNAIQLRHVKPCPSVLERDYLHTYVPVVPSSRRPEQRRTHSAGRRRASVGPRTPETPYGVRGSLSRPHPRGTSRVESFADIADSAGPQLIPSTLHNNAINQAPHRRCVLPGRPVRFGRCSFGRINRPSELGIPLPPTSLPKRPFLWIPSFQ